MPSGQVDPILSIGSTLTYDHQQVQFGKFINADLTNGLIMNSCLTVSTAAHSPVSPAQPQLVLESHLSPDGDSLRLQLADQQAGRYVWAYQVRLNGAMDQSRISGMVVEAVKARYPVSACDGPQTTCNPSTGTVL